MDDNGSTAPDRGRLWAWTSVVLVMLAFLLCIRLGGQAVSALVPIEAPSARQGVLMAVGGSAIGQVVAVLLLMAWLRRERRSLRDLGWLRRAPMRGWIAMVAFTGFWIPSTLFGAMGGGAPVLEPSGFNLAASMLAGPLIGFTEEVFSRGFVMTRLQRGGVGRVGQVLAAGLIFGLAHLGWGALSGTFDPTAAIGAFIATSVLGVAYAGIYLLSDRSLLPVVLSHACSNMVLEPWLALAAVQGNL